MLIAQTFFVASFCWVSCVIVGVWATDEVGLNGAGRLYEGKDRSVNLSLTPILIISQFYLIYLLCVVPFCCCVFVVISRVEEKTGRGLHVNSLAPSSAAYSLNLHDDEVRMFVCLI